MNDRFRALMAHQTHEVAGTHEATPAVEVEVYETPHGDKILKTRHFYALVDRKYARVETRFGVPIGDFRSDEKSNDLDQLIALLQEARRVMDQGGAK